jgi:hypothetical protein
MARNIPGWAAAILEPEHFETFMGLFEADLKRRGVTWQIDDQIALVGVPPKKVRLASLARSIAELPRENWADEIVAQMDLVLGASRTRSLESTTFEEIAPKLLVRLATSAPVEPVATKKLADDLFAVMLVATDRDPIELPKSAASAWKQTDDVLLARAKENVLRDVKVRTASASANPDPRARKKDDAWMVINGSTRLTCAHALLWNEHLVAGAFAGSRAGEAAPKHGSIVTIPSQPLLFARPIDRLDDLRILPWMMDATKSEHDLAAEIDQFSKNVWWSSTDGTFVKLPTRALEDGTTQLVLPKSFVDAVIVPLMASDPPEGSVQPPKDAPMRVVIVGADGKPLA